VPASGLSDFDCLVYDTICLLMRGVSAFQVAWELCSTERSVTRNANS
jgi:hypothetical protein